MDNDSDATASKTRSTIPSMIEKSLLEQRGGGVGGAVIRFYSCGWKSCSDLRVA